MDQCRYSTGVNAPVMARPDNLFSDVVTSAETTILGSSIPPHQSQVSGTETSKSSLGNHSTRRAKGSQRLKYTKTPDDARHKDVNKM